jgi:hypothetical protein
MSCCRTSTGPAGSAIASDQSGAPGLSCLYNPFHTTDENYMAQVNMVFGSFNLHDEFFAKHQLNYLADIVRILHYTGVPSISTTSS